MEFSFNLLDFALVTAVIIIGSATQAAIGMGLNLFAIPLLLLIDTVYAPGPVLAASFMLSFLALWRVPAHVDRQELKFALIGLGTGTAVAAVIAAIIDSSSLIRILGLFVVAGVVLVISGWSASLNYRNLVVAGSAAGFLGTIAGVHAPPIALLYQGMQPERVRGAILTFVGIGNGLSTIALAAVGQFGVNQIIATLLLIPGVLIGLWIAPSLAKLVDASLLRVLILSVSAISGLMLIFG